MKIIVLTDPHITEPGKKIHGIDTNERFASCIRKINAIASDADLCIIMGDLVDVASKLAYQTFHRHIKSLEVPVRLLIGNHDNRNAFVANTQDAIIDDNGYVQSAIETDDALLLFLDTHNPDSNAGCYNSKKREWLQKSLTDARQKPAYIFMHHPPFETGFFIDHSKVEQADEFLKTIQDAGNVRHVFVGHTHRASSGHWNGITWSALHGLANENDFELIPGKPNYRSGPAQIGILLVNGAESVLHFQDALDSYPLIAYSGRSIREPEPTFTKSRILTTIAIHQ